MPTEQQPLIVKGHIIREDENGFVCLDDIWDLADAKTTQQPRFWKRGASVRRVEQTLLESVRNSHTLSKSPLKTVLYTRMGRHGATFAHAVLASLYAGYLSAELEIEVRNVWLRYRAADATLADDILNRASNEANQWAGARAISRVERRKFTDALQRAGVKGFGYATCTDAIYIGLWRVDTKGLKVSMKLPKKSSPRDKMDTFQLSQISLAEGMASGRIDEEGCLGTSECRDAAKISAGFVRQAVEAEKASRGKRARLL